MTNGTSVSDPRSAFKALCARRREIATLSSVERLLGWDQETYMPVGAAAARAEQSALLNKLMHERATAPEMGMLIGACAELEEDNPDSVVAADIRECRRDYEKKTKLPEDLVTELARAGSIAQMAWREARENSDFAAFKPHLEKMLGLAKRKAECLWDGQGELYDALLNEFEVGARSSEIEAIFNPLRERLTGLINGLRDNGTPPDTSVLGRKIPDEKQHAFGQFVLDALGFDLKTGRLDVVTHPFCEGVAPGDTRLTTRYREDHFTDALYGTMHECGHGLYEQGVVRAELDEDGDPMFGRPGAEAVSLGIHESQSRMWENFVGRSLEFWRFALPHAARLMDPFFESVTPDTMYRAVNTASPSFVRVEADEATYNLHVMLRFELERALISGSLSVDDLPGAWTERMQSYLGVTPPDDKRGVLQDVHWAFGLMGYFPTYTLGNLYAAQFWEKINQDIPDLSSQFEQGHFSDLLEWTRTNIHRHGRRYTPGELCERITGRALSSDPLVSYLEGKLKPIYGV